MQTRLINIFFNSVVLLLLFNCNRLNAQCPPGDVELYSQADVNAFVSAYPNCTTINGYMYIGDAGFGAGTSDINNISGLMNITNIQNALYIYYTSLTSIDAISGISTSSLYIDIQGNNDLNSINGFNDITIGGDIYIYGNSNLININAFQLMTSVNSLSIGGNSSLTSISGFNNISSGGYIDISGNVNLTSINALQLITSANSLSIYGNSSLTSLTTMTNLTTLGGLNIGDNNLQNLDNVFPNLNSVNSVGLSDMSNIANLPLWSSSSITSIYLNNNLDINNLNFLNQNLNLSNINVNNNPLLSICNNTPVCNLIYNNLPGNNNFNVSNNSNGCSSFNEVWSSCTNLPYCSNVTYPIQGQRVGVLTKLIWTFSEFATGYKIRAGTSPGASNILNNFDVGNVLSYKFTNPLPYQASIYVTVTPYNQNGNAIGICQERFFTTYTQCPFGYQNFNQSVIDSFPSWFPFCTNLNGVQISANNIDSLYNITTVTNFLDINTSSVGPEKIGLRNLVSVDGFLTINNAGMINLSNLVQVTGNLRLFIIANPIKLNSLEEAGNLHITGTNLNASSLNNFSSVNKIVLDGFNSLIGLESLTNVLSDFSIFISASSSLTNLSGLENLNSVGGLLGLYRYPSAGASGPLSDISALSGLSSVGGLALVKTLVSNLDALDGVSGSLTHLHLERNTQLNDISGLNNLSSISEYLKIQYHGQLADCAIDAVCDAIGQNLQTKIISNNAPNCNSILEVQNQCALLPIELVSFFVTSKTEEVNLFWQTNTEINNHYFDIEYSLDGFHFSTIGKKQGAGNSNTLLDYHYIHKDVGPGLQYYRLKQVDYDGQYSYSEIRSISVVPYGNVITIYPNPTSDKINITGVNGMVYAVFDLVGRQVNSGQISNDVISVDYLPTGMYYLHVIDRQHTSVVKIWKE